MIAGVKHHVAVDRIGVVRLAPRPRQFVPWGSTRPDIILLKSWLSPSPSECSNPCRKMVEGGLRGVGAETGRCIDRVAGGEDGVEKPRVLRGGLQKVR